MTAPTWQTDGPPDWASDERLHEYDTGREPEPTMEQLDAQAKFDMQVASELIRLRVRETARERFTAERAAGLEVPPFDAGSLAEILARPPEPPNRIEELVPSEAGTLIVAQRKTGKTTFKLNLARALITGQDFLGRFGVRKLDGRVAFLNFEVSAAQIARWAHEHQIPEHQLFLANLRGRRNPFAHPEDREHLAQLLRSQDTEALIVDPFGRAYTGQSQNDPGEVGAWLADLDRFARSEAGITDLFLAAHAGWDGERTRGSSALEDWADSIVTLVKDEEQTRYLRAEGRDVFVEEDQLTFDHDTRTLTLAGAGSRKAVAKTRQVDGLIDHAVKYMTDHPGSNGTHFEKHLRAQDVTFQRGDERKALRAAVEKGLLVMEPGKGNAKNYFPTGTLPEIPQASPVGRVESYPNPTLIGGVTTGNPTNQQPPQPGEPCPHGITNGNQPDPFVAGDLACPQCRADATQTEATR